MQRKNPLIDTIIHWGKSINESIIKEQDIRGYSDINEITDVCKKLAVYNSADDKNNGNNVFTAITNEHNHIWFNMNVVKRAVTHFELLGRIYDLDYGLTCDVLSNLDAHIGGCFYYEADRLDELLKLALILYAYGIYDADSVIYRTYRNPELRLRIRAARRLIRECDCEFDIRQGDICFKNDTENAVAQCIDSFIADIGGIRFLDLLYRYELSGKYIPQMGRYIIARDKNLSFAGSMPGTRVPYNYLIQLALKHLESANPMLTESGCITRYEKVLDISGAYLEVFSFQGHHVYEDMFSVFTDFTYILANNLCFEKLFVPRQYNYHFVLMLLDFLLRPQYEHQGMRPRAYSFDSYVVFAEYILKNSVHASEFDIDRIRRDTGLGRNVLNQIIDDVSMESIDVNRSFIHYLDKTNTWQKPVIRKKDGMLFCAGASVVGFGFYEVMYQILCGVYGQRALNRILGRRLEKLVYDMFDKKNISYIRGKYDALYDMPERDCDLIIEGADKMCFIEIKKIPLPNTYEQGDDVAVLTALGDGMLYAQEQIMWHKLRLKEAGSLSLYDESTGVTHDIASGNRRIYSISLCMPEYDFLTNPSVVHLFLESTMFVNYNTYDSGRQNEFDKLNRRIEVLRKLAPRIYDGKVPSAREIFFNASFVSLQQLWLILQYYDSADDFLNYCQTSHSVTCGRGDVYAELLALQKLRT